jgi:hypothetical protein
MANQIDFVLRNGLQVINNAAIGSYATINAAPTNGLIVSGNVGVGTATPVQKLQVVGNIQLTNAAGATSGIYFPDGTYQATSAASYSTPAGGPVNSVQYNTGSGFGGTANFTFHSGNSHVGIGTNQANYALHVVATDGPAFFQSCEVGFPVSPFPATLPGERHEAIPSIPVLPHAAFASSQPKKRRVSDNGPRDESRLAPLP